MKLAQATGAVEVFERQMKNAPDQQAVLRIYDNALLVINGIGLEKSELDGLLQRLAGFRDRVRDPLSVLTKEPLKPAKSVISPQQLDQLEQMMLQACVEPAELLATFGLHRLSLMPAEAYGTARAWLFDCGEQRRGVQVIEPTVSQDPIREKLPTAQQMVDEEARRRGSTAPLLEMENDLPWKD